VSGWCIYQQEANDGGGGGGSGGGGSGGQRMVGDTVRELRDGGHGGTSLSKWRSAMPSRRPNEVIGVQEEFAGQVSAQCSLAGARSTRDPDPIAVAKIDGD